MHDETDLGVIADFAVSIMLFAGSCFAFAIAVGSDGLVWIFR